MPYKHESSHIKLPREKDRRVKLSLEDRQEIKRLYTNTNKSMEQLAKDYHVSRRLISFIVHPWAYEKAKEQHKERRKDWRYYDKDTHNEAIKNTRRYRTQVLKTLTIQEFLSIMLDRINKQKHKIWFLNNDFDYKGTTFPKWSIFIFRRFKRAKGLKWFHYNYYFISSSSETGISSFTVTFNINPK